MTTTISNFLRKTLYADAAISGAAAVLMIAGAPPLASLLDIPEKLLLVSGLILVPFVAMLVVIARRAKAPRLLLVDIIALNVLWVLGSFGLIVFGVISPNILGIAFIAAQAFTVALFAALQIVGLRGNTVAA